MMSTEHEEYEEELDARYFQNDIVATAFEIFEKTSNFDAAVNLLMRVIGTRVGLDRITVIRADIMERMGSLFFNMMIWKNIHRGHRNF